MPRGRTPVGQKQTICSSNLSSSQGHAHKLSFRYRPHDRLLDQQRLRTPPSFVLGQSLTTLPRSSCHARVWSKGDKVSTLLYRKSYPNKGANTVECATTSEPQEVERNSAGLRSFAKAVEPRLARTTKDQVNTKSWGPKRFCEIWEEEDISSLWCETARPYGLKRFCEIRDESSLLAVWSGVWTASTRWCHIPTQARYSAGDEAIHRLCVHSKIHNQGSNEPKNVPTYAATTSLKASQPGIQWTQECSYIRSNDTASADATVMSTVLTIVPGRAPW